MNRRARVKDARTWLPVHQGVDALDAYERWYGVDRLCAIRDLRRLGVAITEEYEAQVRESLDQRRRAGKHAVNGAKQRAAKQRAATMPARLAELYDNAEPIDWTQGWDDGDTATGWDEASCDAGYDAMADVAPGRFSIDEHWQIEDTLLKDGRSLDLRVIETKIVTTIDRFDEVRVDVRITLEANPDMLAKRALGLIFAIGAVSFADADADADADAGADAIEDYEWRADDMLRCLAFDRGRLRFDADHVRGRCMQTRIEIDGEGKITLETVDRGEAATRWIAKLRSKRGMPVTEDYLGHGDDGASLEPIPF